MACWLSCHFSEMTCAQTPQECKRTIRNFQTGSFPRPFDKPNMTRVQGQRPRLGHPEIWMKSMSTSLGSVCKWHLFLFKRKEDSEYCLDKRFASQGWRKYLHKLISTVMPLFVSYLLHTLYVIWNLYSCVNDIRLQAQIRHWYHGKLWQSPKGNRVVTH